VLRRSILVWPHQLVRNLVEELKAEEVERGIELGRSNMGELTLSIQDFLRHWKTILLRKAFYPASVYSIFEVL
jgi:hypothetical protein